MMNADRIAGLSKDGTSRLFIALPLSDAVREQIETVQRLLRPNGWPVTWVAPELAHITLKFLGDTRHDLIPSITGRLERVAQRHQPAMLQTGRCGAFPSLNRPQVLWIGLDGDIEDVVSLASGVDEAMAESGFEAERRPFRPHVTLGRVRRGERLPDDAGHLLHSVPLQRTPLDVRRFQLVRSVLGRSGPTYITLAEWQLGSVAVNQVELVEHG